MRRLLLWAASNRWLAAHAPNWPFARRAVKRFMPGESFESALGAAKQLKVEGIGAILTMLGENINDLSAAERDVKHYEDVLVASSGLGSEISVKPTHLGLDLDPDASYANLLRLARAAAKAGSFLWIDMEGSAYTQRTIDLYARLRKEETHVGIALQAYLHRTAADVASLVKEKSAIRLVKGAYSESSSIAFTDKAEVDANYLALAVLMLPEVERGNLRLVLGTHDVELLKKIWRFGEAIGLKRSQLDLAMLYGIRADEQQRLAREGFPMRCLISYGDAWYAWYLRRLAERPANLLFAARQLLP